MKKILHAIRHWRKQLQKESPMPPEPILPEPSSSTSSEEKLVVEISLFSVFKATLIVIGVILLSQIVVELIDILVTLFVALFLASALSPGVEFFEKRFPHLFFILLKKLHLQNPSLQKNIPEMPRWLAISIVFFLVFGFLFFFLGNLVPTIAGQLRSIAISIEAWARDFLENGGGDSFMSQKIHDVLGVLLANVNAEKIFSAVSENIQAIANNFSDFAGKGFEIFLNTVGALFNIVLILLLTFFLILDRKNINAFFYSLFPQKQQGYLLEKMGLVQRKIGEWVHGQFLLFLIIGGIAFVVFHFIFGLQEYSITLAMVFGLAEFVPYLGPIGSFLIAAPIAFNDGLGTGFGLIIFSALLQFVEGNFIVPMVMKRTVGLAPVATMIALLVGASFPEVINPIMGMILAVPMATILTIFIQDFIKRERTIPS